MVNEWSEYSLGDLCNKITDGAHQSPKAFDGGIPMYSVKDMNDHGFDRSRAKTISEIDYQKLLAQGCQPELNDILIAKDGSVMKHVFKVDLKTKCALLSSIAILKPNLDIVDPDFLVFSILNPLVKNNILSNYVSGSGVPRIVLKDFKKVIVKIPDLETQRSIANVILNQNKKLLLNRQTSQTLEEMAQTLFKSWFVDFDPVFDNLLAKVDFDLTKLPNTFPEVLLKRAEKRLLVLESEVGAATKASLQKRLQSDSSNDSSTNDSAVNSHQHFPGEFENNEKLGWIPKGWEESELGDCIDTLETGRRPKGGVSKYKTGMPSVGAESINGVGNFNYGKLKYVPTEFYLKMKSGKVQDYDVLLYKDGGKPGEFKPRLGMFGKGFPFKEFGINEHVFRIRSKKLGQFFLYFQLGSERVFYNLSVRGGKAAIPGVNQNDVKQQVFLVPDVKILNIFNKYIENNFEKILLTSLESLQLSKLRDTLLPKLISGELQIPEIKTADEKTA